jgi:hypothetical protein
MYTIWMILNLRSGGKKVIPEFKKKKSWKIPENK